MADTFKVTTNALNGMIKDKLEPLADDIASDPNVQTIKGYSTASESPLKAGNGDAFKPAADLFTQFTAFSKRMTDGSAGIKTETTNLSDNVSDVSEQFHSTDDNAQWTVQEVQRLLYDIVPDSGTGTGAGPGPGPATT